LFLARRDGFVRNFIPSAASLSVFLFFAARGKAGTVKKRPKERRKTTNAPKTAEKKSCAARAKGKETAKEGRSREKSGAWEEENVQKWRNARSARSRAGVFSVGGRR
jgi:hypothetical protein